MKSKALYRNKEIKSEAFLKELKNKEIHREKFTNEEDEKIKYCASKYGLRWDKISYHFGPTRTKRQLRERWQNYLDPNFSPIFTPEEDEQMIKLVEKMGQKWSKIASILGNKSGIACRNRHRVLAKVSEQLFPLSMLGDIRKKINEFQLMNPDISKKVLNGNIEKNINLKTCIGLENCESNMLINNCELSMRIDNCESNLNINNCKAINNDEFKEVENIENFNHFDFESTNTERKSEVGESVDSKLNTFGEELCSPTILEDKDLFFLPSDDDDISLMDEFFEFI